MFAKLRKPRWVIEERERLLRKRLAKTKTPIYEDGAEVKAVNCLGSIKAYDATEELGYIEFGRVEKGDVYFRAEDVPRDFLEMNDGDIPSGLRVEFTLVNTRRGLAARELSFPSLRVMSDLGLTPEVVAGACAALGRDPRHDPGAADLINPAPVQFEAIPKILAGDDLVIAAETGSGKSLAYMLPLVQQVQALESERAMDYGLDNRQSSPLALIICPTRELALQAQRTMKKICSHAKLRVRCVHGGSGTLKKQRKEISQLVDVLIATPDRLLKLFRMKDIKFKDIAHIAIDEADFMLTQGFADLYELLGEIEKETKQFKIRYTLATASVTKPLKKIFQEDPRWQHMRLLESRSLHRPQNNTSHTFILTKGRDKVEMVISLLRPEITGLAKSRQTIIFCNTVLGVRSVTYQMREAFLQGRCDRFIGCLHKDMPTEERQEALRAFAHAETKVLICSDIAQRGLDIPACGHVVNFDFPLNSVDYLHRAGRTSRYGELGKVTSLVKKGDKYLARAIERSCKLGRPINDLSADKRDYLRGGALHHILEHQPRANMPKLPSVRAKVKPLYDGALR